VFVNDLFDYLFQDFSGTEIRLSDFLFSCPSPFSSPFFKNRRKSHRFPVLWSLIYFWQVFERS